MHVAQQRKRIGGFDVLNRFDQEHDVCRGVLQWETTLTHLSSPELWVPAKSLT